MYVWHQSPAVCL